MSQPFDASKSLATLEQDNTVIAVIEMSQSKWLVAAVVPGVKRQPLKKRRGKARWFADGGRDAIAGEYAAGKLRGSGPILHRGLEAME